MTFDYLIRSCELEEDRVSERNLIHLNIILNSLIEYINKEFNKNPDQTMGDINKRIVNKVEDYLASTTSTKVLNRTILYYLNRGAYSGKTSFSKIYDKVYKEDLAGKIDIINMKDEDFDYTYNMEENMESLVKVVIRDIRKLKNGVESIPNIDFVMSNLKSKSSKERATYLNRITQDEKIPEKDRKKLKEDLEMAYRLYFKSEIDLVEEQVKECTQTAGREVKEDCIKHITKSVGFLDELGLLEQFTKMNNKNYKKIYMNNASYSYDQVKDLLNENNLKKLNTEELIIMSAFWTNRVNKILKDLNKGLYIVNHSELLHETVENENESIYMVTRKDMKNLNVKMNAIHKLFFELYSNLDDPKSDKSVKNISRYIKGITKKHKSAYKEYFDKLFPESENSLKEDLCISNIFENARYNSYKVKALGIQALLVSLFNSNSKNIENFGYVEEPIKGKKEILIVADIKGYNMPLALHTSRDLVLDFLKSSQGNTMFPVYCSYDDFKLGEGEILSAQILVPLPKEIDKEIEIACGKTTSRDRYRKTIEHLNYLRKNGKMPNHMLTEEGVGKNKKRRYVRKYVDLGDDSVKLQKSR